MAGIYSNSTSLRLCPEAYEPLVRQSILEELSNTLGTSISYWSGCPEAADEDMRSILSDLGKLEKGGTPWIQERIFRYLLPASRSFPDRLSVYAAFFFSGIKEVIAKNDPTAKRLITRLVELTEHNSDRTRIAALNILNRICGNQDLITSDELLLIQENALSAKKRDYRDLLQISSDDSSVKEGEIKKSSPIITEKERLERIFRYSLPASRSFPNAVFVCAAFFFSGIKEVIARNDPTAKGLIKGLVELTEHNLNGIRIAARNILNRTQGNKNLITSDELPLIQETALSTKRRIVDDYADPPQIYSDDSSLLDPCQFIASVKEGRIKEGSFIIIETLEGVKLKGIFKRVDNQYYPNFVFYIKEKETFSAVPAANLISSVPVDSENNFCEPKSLSSLVSNELTSFSAETAETFSSLPIKEIFRVSLEEPQKQIAMNLSENYSGRGRLSPE